MFANVFEFTPRPARANRSAWNDLSAIERRFSRIAQELAKRWKRNDIDAYLDSLMLDDRGDRQGFPTEVLEELMFLSNLRWQLQHPRYSRADEGLVEQFSCNPVAHLDSRFCEPKRAWVLG
ncbi:MAG: hypothetical protein PHD37_11980 [Gallionellaceae bacterium]|nr:hypothetical protein [Gallionellaceae bacterium]